jgi:RNA polymerase sigma factor (sigma-70 family)
MLPEDAAILVGRFHDGDGEAGEDLYRLVSQVTIARLLRCGAPRESAEDSAHDTFLIVLGAIQSGELREPGRLMGFVDTVIRRRVARHITSTARGRRRCVGLDCEILQDRGRDPEHEVIDHELLGMVLRALAGMKPQAREVIVRSYLQEQPNARVRSEMGMTEIRHRNLKHCALSMLRQRVQRAARVAG